MQDPEKAKPKTVPHAELAAARQNFLYPGLSAILQHRQTLEAELGKLQTDWETVVAQEPQAGGAELAQIRDQGQTAARDVICRLDRLDAGLSAIKKE